MANPESLELVYPDLLKISAKAKHMDIISHAEGAALCIQAMHTKGEESGNLTPPRAFGWSGFI